MGVPSVITHAKSPVESPRGKEQGQRCDGGDTPLALRDLFYSTNSIKVKFCSQETAKPRSLAGLLTRTSGIEPSVTGSPVFTTFVLDVNSRMISRASCAHTINISHHLVNVK